MLPNMRLSGTANDSIGDFLAVSSAQMARSAASTAASVAAANNSVKNNAASAASFAAASRLFAASVSASGWGPLPTSASSSSGSASFASTVGGTQSRTLSDQVKESSGWSQQANSATSMPWAAAVKAPSEHSQVHSMFQHHPASLAAAAAAAASMGASNALGDGCNSIGSWTSPETSSSSRNGWNADGSLKNDGVPDDGTAIWGNPSIKKTGIDWTEKESSLNPPQANNNSEKRVQKSEPIISSINGTEAWGAPAGGGTKSNSNSGVKKSNNSQQLANLSENSGNNYVSKPTTINNEPLSWNESSSLQQTATKNRNSSPPNDSVWNYLNQNDEPEMKGKASVDWLSSDASSNNRIEELSKQLEATRLFNGNSVSSASLLTKNSPPSACNNPNLDNNLRQSTAAMLGGSNSAGTIGANLIGGGVNVLTSNAINDLKQPMSANFSTNDLLAESSSIRQQQANAALSSNQAHSHVGNYSLGVTPSRELLKQMVHQIQLAVQAGHLNAHILNQPLSTPTLQLVYALLQHIKLLQQSQEVQLRLQSVNKQSGDIANNVELELVELQIIRVQQNISILQKAIAQQQAALSKNDSLVESNLKQQHAANNSSYNNSYANISKLSTNMKVPSNTSNMSNTISNSSNIDSFRRSSLIDTLSNSNSDQLRSAAQAFEASANLDKNVSPSLQSSANLNNILNNKQQSEFAKQQNFTNHHNADQQAKGNLLSSAAQSSTSPAAAAWLAFSQSGDMKSSHNNGAWSRLPVQEQPQFDSDLLSELSAKAWRNGQFMMREGRETATNPANPVSSMAPGSSLARPNSASSNIKQLSENDILNKDPSLFYDWTSNQTSDTIKRNFDAANPSSSSSSAIGGLSLQSNPWLFAPTSSNSLNLGSGGLGNLIGSDKIDSKIESDKSNNEKMRSSIDQLGLLGSNNLTGNAQRAMYDWGNSSQFNNDNNTIGSNKQTATSSSATALGSRPAPPPGLISNLGSLGVSSGNEISSTLNAGSNKQTNNETHQMPSSGSSSSLWSGAWFD